MKLKTLATTVALLLSSNVFAGNILVVMSDKDSMELKAGKTYKTGFYINELMEPVKQFIDAGHTVTFATPSGLAPTVDKNSDNLQYFRNEQSYYNTHVDLLKKLKITEKLSSWYTINTTHYS